MRAARRQGVFGVVACGTGPFAKGACSRPSCSNQRILRVGYKRGLHAFQGGQRHDGRFAFDAFVQPRIKWGGRKQLPESQFW